MQPTKNTVNIENTGYKTVVMPEGTLNNVKQRLGDEFVWKYDEKCNQLYLTEKSKNGGNFSAESGKNMQETAKEWYNGELADKWND